MWLVQVVVLMNFGIKTLQGGKEVALVRIKERLSEVEVLQLVAVGLTGRQHDCQQQPDSVERYSAHGFTSPRFRFRYWSARALPG